MIVIVVAVSFVGQQCQYLEKQVVLTPANNRIFAQANDKNSNQKPKPTPETEKHRFFLFFFSSFGVYLCWPWLMEERVEKFGEGNFLNEISCQEI